MCLVCGGVLACIHPPPFTILCILAITGVPCRAVPSVAGCPVVRCPWLTPRVIQYVIMSSIVLASIYGMLGSQYIGSQVLSLSH